MASDGPTYVGSRRLGARGSESLLTAMLQGLASRTVKRNNIYTAGYLRRANALSRSVLVTGRYALAAPSVRHYAQTPPGGSGGGQGMPGFKFPMQQQYAKGDALKEFVRTRELRSYRLFDACHCMQSIDLTELAKSGKLDPVIGRDEGKRVMALFVGVPG